MSSAPRPYTLRLVLLFLCPLPIPYGSSAHLNALSFSAFSLSLSPTWPSTPLDLLRSPFHRVSFSKLLRELSISCASRPLCIQHTQTGCCCPVAPENRGNARVTVMREFCNCARRKRGGVAWRVVAWCAPREAVPHAAPRHRGEGDRRAVFFHCRLTHAGLEKWSLASTWKRNPDVLVSSLFSSTHIDERPVDVSVLWRGIWQFHRSRELTVFDDGISKAV